jgi:hypothetical protein
MKPDEKKKKKNIARNDRNKRKKKNARYLIGNDDDRLIEFLDHSGQFRLLAIDLCIDVDHQDEDIGLRKRNLHVRG